MVSDSDGLTMVGNHGMYHYLHKTRDARHKSAIAEEGRQLISLSLEAWQRLSEERIVGLSTNALIASMPEISPIFDLIDPGKPLPGLLQLQLKDEVRTAMESRINEVIGPDAFKTASSESASEAARATQIGGESNPLQGGDAFKQAFDPLLEIHSNRVSSSLTKHAAAQYSN